MIAGLAAFLSRVTHSMERLLRLIDEMPLLSPDLAFLKRSPNAVGYLQKTLGPHTEALETLGYPGKSTHAPTLRSPPHQRNPHGY